MPHSRTAGHGSMWRIEAVTGEERIVEVAELARAIWFEHYPGIISWSQVHYMLERGYRPEVIANELARGVHWDVIEEDGEPFGFTAYEARSDAVVVDKLYVLAAERRRGAARALLTRAESLASRSPATPRLRLTVNKRNLDAVRSYLRLGFSFERAIVKPIGFGFVMDDYVMTRRIAASAAPASNARAAT